MASPIQNLRERFRNLNNIAGPATTAVLIFLAVMFAASLTYLIISGGPWESSLQKKLARGSHLNWENYRQLGIGWGVVFVAVLLAGTLVTAKWWVRPCRAVLSDQPRRKFPKLAARLYFLGLLITAAMAITIRAPRLNHSFWNDEEAAFRKYVYGESKALADGTLQHEAVPWNRALFDNEKVNNHLWSTIESRIGMALWNHPEKGSPTGVPAFQESAPRIIPLATSGLAIIALGWLGWLLGLPRAGLAAALLLALSPWHIRYSVEIRGYSTMLLAMMLAIGSLIRALESGQWRWWIAFAAAQAWYLLCFAGSAYVAVGINIMAMVCIISIRRAPLENALRLVVANVISALPLAVFLTPALLQIREYVSKNHEDYAPLGFTWFQDLYSHMITAMPWAPNSTSQSNGSSVQAMAKDNSFLLPMLIYVIPTLLGVGLIIMLLRQWRSRLLAGGLLLAAALTYGQATLSQAQLFSWYLLYLLPLACLAMPYVSALAPKRLSLVPIVIVVIFFGITRESRFRLTSTPRQPLREVAQLARNEATTPAGNDPLPLTATFCTSDRQIKSYDPRAIILPESTSKAPTLGADKLLELMNQARTNSVPLVVYYCNRAKAKEKYADVLEVLEDPANWEKLAFIPGLENMFSYNVYVFGNLRQEGHTLKLK